MLAINKLDRHAAVDLFLPLGDSRGTKGQLHCIFNLKRGIGLSPNLDLLDDDKHMKITSRHRDENEQNTWQVVLHRASKLNVLLKTFNYTGELSIEDGDKLVFVGRAAASAKKDVHFIARFVDIKSLLHQRYSFCIVVNCYSNCTVLIR